MNIDYKPDYKLIHPDTEELVAIFQGYSDTGSEVWLTTNGIEYCNFLGFADDGWTQWSQEIAHFANNVKQHFGVEE